MTGRDLWDKPVQVARGAFSSQAVAVRARADLLAQSREQFAGRTWTVARWLRYWLTTRKSIRPTTLHIYARPVEKDLIPTIGHLRLAELFTSRVRRERRQCLRQPLFVFVGRPATVVHE